MSSSSDGESDDAETSCEIITMEEALKNRNGLEEVAHSTQATPEQEALIEKAIESCRELYTQNLYHYPSNI